MTATGLPVATSLPAAASTASTPAPADAAASTDFLLMLGQLLGAGVPQANAKGPAVPSESDTEVPETQDAMPAGVPFMLVTPWNSQVDVHGPVAEGATDALKSLGLMSVTGSSAKSEPGQLTNSLLDADQDASATLLTSHQSATAPAQDVAQGARLASAGDAARGLHQPVGSSAWADELGTRMALMTERGQYSASLRLSPEHLGPLEVRISVRDDQASVWFGAAHADTRAALEQALPRLRELFASQGLSLTDAGVFREPPREQGKLAPSLSGAGEAVVGESEAVAQVGPIRLGLLDAYA